MFFIISGSKFAFDGYDCLISKDNKNARRVNFDLETCQEQNTTFGKAVAFAPIGLFLSLFGLREYLRN
jgi:hypothetical protein